MSSSEAARRRGPRWWGRELRVFLLRLVDVLVPRRRDHWVFPAYFLGPGAFCDNSLAVFEAVKDDARIRKIILAREVPVQAEGRNVVVRDMHGWRGAWELMRAGVVFAQHSVWLDYARARHQIRGFRGRHVINLWHGISLKDLSHANTGIHTPRGMREMRHTHLITSSAADREKMATAFPAVPKQNLWITGIPRNDFLLRPRPRLPSTYREQEERLQAQLAGRRLVLYAPTYRETQTGGVNYEFSREELARLQGLCLRHGSIVGVRFHAYRRPPWADALLATGAVLDLSAERYDDVRLLLRSTAVLVTDYSSIWLDALYLGVPGLSFAYDLDHYMERQRGFFHRPEEVFAGNLCRDFGQLMLALDERLAGRGPGSAEAATPDSVFFQWRDAANGARVAARVKLLAGIEDPPG